MAIGTVGTLASPDTRYILHRNAKKVKNNKPERSVGSRQPSSTMFYVIKILKTALPKRLEKTYPKNR
jgi:hypothetical protein